MKYTPQIEKAIQISAEAHRKQFRKGKPNLPYVSHPYSVFVILSEYTDNEDILIAGLLHDVLEDADPSEYTETSLREIFGDQVVNIIREVSESKDGSLTDIDAKSNWETRKIAYLKHMETVSKEALMVSVADKIHNLTCALDDHKNEGDLMWQKFNSSKEKQLWFYKEFNNAVQDRGATDLTSRLNILTLEFEKIVTL